MNRGNIIAKLSCQVYKFLPVQFIKKNKETQNYWLTDVMIQVQNEKKTKQNTQLHITVKQILYIRKIPFKYLYTCYHVILLTKTHGLLV